MKELELKIKQAFKIQNKWHFISEMIEGVPVSLKFYIGQTETDLQIFTINGLHCNIGFNYARKTVTQKAILGRLNEFFKIIA